MQKPTAVVLSMLLALAVAGCDKGTTESGAGSADKKDDKPAASASEKKAEAEGGIDGAAALEHWNKTLGDFKRAQDPFDKKLEEWKKFAGEPHKTEGKDAFWYFWHAKDNYCREFKTIGTAGGSTMMTDDKSKCGK